MWVADAAGAVVGNGRAGRDRPSGPPALPARTGGRWSQRDDASRVAAARRGPRRHGAVIADGPRLSAADGSCCGRATTAATSMRRWASRTRAPGGSSTSTEPQSPSGRKIPPVASSPVGDPIGGAAHGRRRTRRSRGTAGATARRACGAGPARARRPPGRRTGQACRRPGGAPTGRRRTSRRAGCTGRSGSRAAGGAPRASQVGARAAQPALLRHRREVEAVHDPAVVRQELEQARPCRECLHRPRLILRPVIDQGRGPTGGWRSRTTRRRRAATDSGTGAARRSAADH